MTLPDEQLTARERRLQIMVEYADAYEAAGGYATHVKPGSVKCREIFSDQCLGGSADGDLWHDFVTERDNRMGERK